MNEAVSDPQPETEATSVAHAHLLAVFREWDQNGEGIISQSDPNIIQHKIQGSFETFLGLF